MKTEERKAGGDFGSMVRHLENARTCIEGNYYSIVIESDIGFAVEGIEKKRDLPSVERCEPLSGL